MAAAEHSKPSRGEPKGAVGFRVAFVVLLLCAGFLPVLLAPAIPKRYSRGCSNNLRQLGLASLQYSDDKGFFPHVRGVNELDGDYDSNHVPKTLRSLQWYGYHDNPEGWICPSSYDVVRPPPNAVNRRWFWGGTTLPTPGPLSPFVDGLPDPTLRETDELSYGWTRKAMNSNARSTKLLGADRALREAEGAGVRAVAGEIGNHADGLNLLAVDCTVAYNTIPANYPKGFADLSVLRKRRGGFREREDPTGRWMRAGAVTALLLALLAWLGYMGFARGGREDS